MKCLLHESLFLLPVPILQNSVINCFNNSLILATNINIHSPSRIVMFQERNILYYLNKNSLKRNKQKEGTNENTSYREDC